MKISRKSMISGVERTMDLNVTEEQFRRWKNGTPIQRAMPHLSASEREFILTGITDDEWEEEFDDLESYDERAF